ncbi:alpha/beta fold hydrolase [Saccharibacillus sp. O23]|uniref:alpha/beta fold hydrolase n=1 Tax=Saccharibacillus sp. O23 TaxID=2009338 RepID=UPI0015C64751|nr:alpha/beta fold hydrolase [Saccharibacillus sp. O23]
MFARFRQTSAHPAPHPNPKRFGPRPAGASVRDRSCPDAPNRKTASRGKRPPGNSAVRSEPDRSFTMPGADPGISLCVHAWPLERPAAIVQIAHGMGESGARYAGLAAALNAAGYAVYAGDHRGHGRTTGRTPAGPLRQGYAGPDALHGMCRDLLAVAAEIDRRHPGAPVILLGHSMGSFLAQKLMADKPAAYAGFILTGSSGARASLPLKLGGLFAAAEARLLSPAFASPTLNALVFGPFGRGFRPRRTFFDWLSRDEEAVDDFVRLYGGTLFSCGFFRDFFRLLLEIQHPEIPKRLDRSRPVLLCSGEYDPVGGAQGLRRLRSVYEAAGLEDLECRLYGGARHELAFELNRDEVAADWIRWLDRHFAAEASADASRQRNSRQP